VSERFINHRADGKRRTAHTNFFGFLEIRDEYHMPADKESCRIRTSGHEQEESLAKENDS
jgi:hypothetical protein